MPIAKGEYIDDVAVVDPKTGETVTLHVWRNPLTGKLFAADVMDLDATRGYLVDPYDGTQILLADTFSGLPK